MTSRISRKLLTILAGSGYASKVKSIFGSNLVAYWKLNETTGTSAADSSTTGATGTYNSVTVGNAIGPGPSMTPAPTFDGINDNVTLAAGPLTALDGAWSHEELTISLWAKMDTLAHWNDANQYYIFNIGIDVNNRYLFVKHTANGFDFQYTRNASSLTVLLGTQTSLAWRHYAITISKSANIFRAFLDGVQRGADQAVNNTFTGSITANFTQIGSFNNTLYWPGNICQVAIGKAALTPAQIAQLAVAS